MTGNSESCPHSLWQFRYLTVQVFLSSTDWFMQRFLPESLCFSALVRLPVSVLTCLSLQFWGQQQLALGPSSCIQKELLIFQSPQLYSCQEGVVISRLLLNLNPKDFFPDFCIPSFSVGICLPIKDIWYRPVRDQVRCVGTRKLQVKHLIVILEIKGAIVKL